MVRTDEPIMVASYAKAHPTWSSGYIQAQMLAEHNMVVNLDFVKDHRKKSKHLGFVQAETRGRKKKLKDEHQKKIIKKLLKKPRMTPGKVAAVINKKDHGFTVCRSTIINSLKRAKNAKKKDGVTSFKAR